MIESISIVLCRKTASGNLVQFQLSVIRGSSISVSLGLTSILGEAGLDSEHPSPVWRVQQGLQCPVASPWSLVPTGTCLVHPPPELHCFFGPNVWWRVMNFTQMCVVWRGFLCESPGSVSLFSNHWVTAVSYQSLNHRGQETRAVSQLVLSSSSKLCFISIVSLQIYLENSQVICTRAAWSRWLPC